MTNTKPKRWIAIGGVVITSALAALSVISQSTWPASWQGPVLTVAATITGLLTAVHRIWQAITPVIEPLTTPQKRRYVRRKKDSPVPSAEEKKT